MVYHARKCNRLPLDRYMYRLTNAKRVRRNDVQDSSAGFHHMISCLLADQASNNTSIILEFIELIPIHVRPVFLRHG
jgi:hypothetical protein